MPRKYTKKIPSPKPTEKPIHIPKPRAKKPIIKTKLDAVLKKLKNTTHMDDSDDNESVDEADFDFETTDDPIVESREMFRNETQTERVDSQVEALLPLSELTLKLNQLLSEKEQRKKEKAELAAKKLLESENKKKEKAELLEKRRQERLAKQEASEAKINKALQDLAAQQILVAEQTQKKIAADVLSATSIRENQIRVELANRYKSEFNKLKHNLNF